MASEEAPAQTTAPPPAPESSEPTWRKRLLSLPGLALAAAATATGSWAATHFLTSVTTPPANPVSLSFESDPARISGASSAGRAFVFPPSYQTVGNPGANGCDGLHAWGVTNGGADLHLTTVQVIAQGESDGAVQLTAMRVRILSKSTPLAGAAAGCDTAGQAQLRSIDANLDTAPPTVSYKNNSGVPFGFTLAKGETETFTVTATTDTAYYRWVLDIDAVVDGKKTTMTVGPADGFATSASPDRTYWSWLYGAGGWQLQPRNGGNVKTVTTPQTLPAGSSLPQSP